MVYLHMYLVISKWNDGGGWALLAGLLSIIYYPISHAHLSLGEVCCTDLRIHTPELATKNQLD